MAFISNDRGYRQMDAAPAFLDHYAVLRVDPNCDAKVLANAYHALAKQFHPDHSDGADVEKLTEVIEAYKVLKDADSRARYDASYAAATGFVFSAADEEQGGEQSALSDADAHARILLFLYRKRREQARDPGVGRFYVHQLLNCSEELFEFHIWYLKEKGFVITTEQGTLAITIEGVDHVIATSRTHQKEHLRLSQS